MERDYTLDGDTLTICDNAPNLNKGRPTTFEIKSGSGYVSSRSSVRSPERQMSGLVGLGPGDP